MTKSDPYARHKDYVAPARDGRAPLSIMGGLILSEIAFALSPLILFPFYGAEMERALEGRTPWTLFLALTLYGIPALAILQWVRHHHGRSGWTLIGPPAAALRDLLRVAWAVCLALLAIEILPPTINPAAFETMRPVPLWLAALPLAVVSTLIQSGSEEIIFRGYLQQRMAVLSDRPLVWMFFPSLLFGVLHYWNAPGEAEGVFWIIWATLLGLACADLTARTGNIGAAIGLHTVNNLFAFCIVGMNGGPDGGFALFLFAYSEPQQGPAMDTLLSFSSIFSICLSALYVAIMWLAARVAVRR